jgi:hypothetical protein
MRHKWVPRLQLTAKRLNHYIGIVVVILVSRRNYGLPKRWIVELLLYLYGRHYKPLVLTQGFSLIYHIKLSFGIKGLLLFRFLFIVVDMLLMSILMMLIVTREHVSHRKVLLLILQFLLPSRFVSEKRMLNHESILKTYECMHQILHD